MLQSDIEVRIAPLPTDEHPVRRMTGGPLGSLALHVVLVLLLVFGDPWDGLQAPAPVTQMVPINLVQLGEATASPLAPVVAPIPQEPAREVAQAEPERPVPAPATPPPPAAEQPAEPKSPPALATAATPASQAEAPKAVATAEPEKSLPAVETPTPAPAQQTDAKSASVVPAVVTPEPKPPPPKPIKAPKLDATTTAKVRPQPVPVDPLSARLEMLAQLRQPAPPMPPNPRQQEGTGAANVTAASADAARARDASYSVKDFIRAQVERRWNLDGTRLKGGDWVVAIHIVLSPDGSVSQAEIVDDPRYRSETGYRDFALSARNAVLLSSPLTVPPGAFDIARDIIVDFNSKQVSQ